jgi:hypothetical protein
MTVDPLEDFLTRLRGHIEACRPPEVEGDFVLDDDDVHPDPNYSDTAAMFSAEGPDGKPEIRLFQPWKALPVVRRICALAHEFGHCGIYRTQGPAKYAEVDRLRKQDDTVLTQDNRQAIVDDEGRAWEVARRTLRGLGFSEWEAFDAFRVESLNTYERRYRARFTTPDLVGASNACGSEEREDDDNGGRDQGLA